MEAVDQDFECSLGQGVAENHQKDGDSRAISR